MNRTEELERKLQGATTDERRLALLAALVSACTRHGAKPSHSSEKGLRYGKLALEIAARLDGESESPDKVRECVRDALIGMGHIRRRDGSREAGIELAERALRLAEEEKSGKDIGRACLLLGSLWFDMGEAERARSLHQRALETAVEAGDRAVTTQALISVGVTHLHARRYDQALESLLDGLSLAEEIGSTEDISRALHHVGDVHLYLGHAEAALEHYQRAKAGWEELGAKPPLAGTLIGIGVVHQRSQEFEKALACFERALRISENAGDRGKTAKALNRLAALHWEREEHVSALGYAERSLEIRVELGDRRGMAHTCLEIGRLRIELDDYDAAHAMIARAQQLGRDLGDERLQLAAHNSFSALWKLRGDYRRAYDSLKAYLDGKLDYFRTDTRRALAEAQARYELEKRDREAEIYRLRNIELAETNRKLTQALEEVQVLGGLLPICSSCKRIRDDKGYWNRIESFIQARSGARFSHGLCPDCVDEYR